MSELINSNVYRRTNRLINPDVYRRTLRGRKIFLNFTTVKKNFNHEAKMG